jgi:glucose-6-phosphate dehydrogenase assembly protein OpcA
MAAPAPEQILGELHKLWASLGEQGRAGNGGGVLRACTMTLVVVAEASEDPQALGETIAALMPEHPARAIVIRLGGGARELEWRVYSQCWTPFGQGRQICCEQVEIAASEDGMADLAPVLMALAAPDLPVALWCRSTRLAAMPQFRRIAAIARKAVLQTATAAELPRLAELAAAGIIAGDLAWTRVTRWREALARMFDNRSHLEVLPRIARVEVAFSEPQETSAWYLGAWVRDALADAGVSAELRVSRQAGAGPLAVELAGEGVRARLVRENERLIATFNQRSTCTSLTQPTDYFLMREELAILRRDPVFERTLASAVRLAYPGGK